MSLLDISKRVAECKGCSLHHCRKNTVPGEGHPHGRLMIIGEAPGAEEDETGRPFVGASGKLVDSCLAFARIPREDVFLTNVLKCRPPDNRTPNNEEMIACGDYLEQQIKIVRPQIILSLGKIASEYTLKKKINILTENGHLHFSDFAEAVITAYHPAYVLRMNTPVKREEFYNVFSKVKALLG